MEKWEYEKIEVEDQKIVCFTYDKHWHRCRNNKCAHKVKEKVENFSSDNSELDIILSEDSDYYSPRADDEEDK